MGARALSLKARALGYLARREHSRLELERKLAPHAESSEAVERVLDELERAQWLSNERFAESLVHRRAQRFGVARVRAELQQHRIDDALVAPHLQALRTNEIERARQVWRKRFGSPAASAEERAKHIRFLTARGFSSDAIRGVLRDPEPDPDA